MSPERQKEIDQAFGKALIENPLLFGIARAQQQGAYPSREVMFKHMVASLQAQIDKMKQEMSLDLFRK